MPSKNLSALLASSLVALAGCSTNLNALDAADEVENNDGVSESPLLAAGAVSIGSSADTYVASGGSSGTNFGAATSVHSDGDSRGRVVRGFIRFDLSPYPTLTKAELRVFVTNGSVNSADFVVTSDTQWSEGRMTWNTQPMADGLTAATLGRTTGGTFVTVDVTAAAKAGTVLSLAVMPRSNDAIWFASREATNASHRPQLILTGTTGGGPADGGSADAGTPDTGAPTVVLTSPASQATFTTAQTVTITAGANDNVGVARVDFFDGTKLLGTDTTAPYSVAWVIASADNGSHALSAKAFDAAGNSASSAAANVTVNIATTGDTQPPTVSLTSPAAGATFTSAQTLTLAASAADNVGVTRVEFFDGTTLLGTDTTTPYTFGWSISTSDNGTHALTAKAYDAAGNSAISPAKSVTINVATTGGGTATDPDLKIAFIGDTEGGANFKSVLSLIKAEGAQALMIQGDLGYSTAAATWFSVLNTELGSTFPVFASEGNHDAAQGWSNYVAPFQSRWSNLGATVDAINPGDSTYAITYRGLYMMMVGQTSGNVGTYASAINSKLSADKHIWRICSWHKNMQKMQIGGKGDEMSWAVYDNCRANGAIVATGHEHSYERTRTLSDFSTQTTDSSCSDPNNLCVGAGKSFGFVSGLGGNSIRDQQLCLPGTFPYGCKQEWAKIYTSTQSAKYGALFITFNVGGNPNKATGYFKNIAGEVVDQFNITKQ